MFFTVTIGIIIRTIRLFIELFTVFCNIVTILLRSSICLISMSTGENVCEDSVHFWILESNIKMCMISTLRTDFIAHTPVSDRSNTFNRFNYFFVRIVMFRRIIKGQKPFPRLWH